MGNLRHAESNPNSELDLSNLKRSAITNDAYFGRIQLWVCKDRILFSKIHHIYYRSSMLESIHEQRIQLEHKNLIGYHGYATQTSGDIQSQVQLFNYYPTSIRQYLNQRAAIVPEPELWRIIEQIIDVCSYLQNNGLYHGNLLLKNIKYHHGHVYLLDFKAIPTLYNCYETSLTENTYVSPEHYTGNYDDIKSDVFILGISLLELLTLKNQQFLYDKDGIDFQTIKETVLSMQGTYSTQLLILLGYMLKKRENERPDFNLLHQMVKERTSTSISHHPLQQSSLSYQKQSYAGSAISLSPQRSAWPKSVIIKSPGPILPRMVYDYSCSIYPKELFQKKSILKPTSVSPIRVQTSINTTSPQLKVQLYSPVQQQKYQQPQSYPQRQSQIRYLSPEQPQKVNQDTFKSQESTTYLPSNPSFTNFHNTMIKNLSLPSLHDKDIADKATDFSSNGGASLMKYTNTHI